jgi:hypothetical protein
MSLSAAHPDLHCTDPDLTHVCGRSLRPLKRGGGSVCATSCWYVDVAANHNEGKL